MSEKDGKRVLSPAEKGEADSLTNKQWLYIIGRSAERGNGEKKGRPDVILTVAERILSDIAAIATVIALGVAVFQISVGNWQFDRSEPRFSWFDTGLVSYTTEATLPDGLSGTGEVQAIVVSNTGRTGDTIVGMGRAGDGDAMVLCTPEFDEDGNLMDRDAVSVGGGTVALQPGKARNARHCTGGPRGQDHRVRRVIFLYGFYREFIRIGQPHGFGGHKPHPQAFGFLDAAALQLCTGNRLSKAVVVFDLLGPVQRTGAFGQHGGVHPRADRVQCGRHARRAGTDD